MKKNIEIENIENVRVMSNMVRYWDNGVIWSDSSDICIINRAILHKYVGMNVEYHSSWGRHDILNAGYHSHCILSDN